MHIFIIVLLIFLGASWGSFLNVIAYRTSKKESFLKGRSKCVHCHNVLYWYDMIPIFSWIFLRGKCRFCAKSISTRYLLVEIFTGLLFVFGGLLIVDLVEIALYIAVVSFFVVLFIYDAIAFIVPDRIVVPAIIIIFALNLFVAQDIASILLGGLVGGLWFLIQFILSKGRWVGGGDIRIGILMGFLVGYPLIWLSLGIAYIAGSIV